MGWINLHSKPGRRSWAAEFFLPCSAFRDAALAEQIEAVVVFVGCTNRRSQAHMSWAFQETKSQPRHSERRRDGLLSVPDIGSLSCLPSPATANDAGPRMLVRMHD